MLGLSGDRVRFRAKIGFLGHDSGIRRGGAMTTLQRSAVEMHYGGFASALFGLHDVVLI